MILIDVKKMIKDKGEICLSELYSFVDGDKGLIDQALSELLEKGIIHEVITESGCKGCPMQCNTRGERVFRIS